MAITEHKNEFGTDYVVELKGCRFVVGGYGDSVSVNVLHPEDSAILAHPFLGLTISNEEAREIAEAFQRAVS
jgi:hypothetical protein